MTALLTDPICRQHDPGPGHPESQRRYDAVIAGLRAAGLDERLEALPGREIAREDLLLVHTAEYLDLAEREIREGESQLSTGDTSVCEASWEAARRGAGCALAAVDAVMEGRAANAFCAVRPPGHHATADRGMGFCVLNNVALAARHAQRRHGIRRALIIDWDVHHGNGTQDIFYGDGSVFFFSTHQWPLYPGTGRTSETGSGAGRGMTLNCPLPAGSGREEIFQAFEEKLLPAADAFRPEIVLISAGFDSRIGDPLGNFMLTDSDFANLTRLALGIARKHAGGRLVSMLEGGYNLGGLASAAVAHVSALLEGRGQTESLR
jgi:acetoin utilization deacetylase AcuC-like enzyme